MIYTIVLKSKRLIFLFLLIILSSSTFYNLFSQSILSKPTRQSSLEAFSKGNYDQAYSEFIVLLQNYSKDPAYNYYSGVCLVKLKRSPDMAITFLKQALQSSSQLKTLPTDALFYLGQAQQMAGSFIDASDSYNLFTDQVGKREAKDLGVPEYIQQCAEKKGSIPNVAHGPADNVITPNSENIKPEEKPNVKEVIAPAVVLKTTLNREIPASYDLMLGDALKLQYKSDSVTAITSKQKTDLLTLSDSQKPALKVIIAENEVLAASFQKSADEKYKEAESAMAVDKAGTTPQLQQAKSGSMTVKDSVKQEISHIRKDSVILSDNKAIKQSDTINKIIPLSYKAVEVFSFFEVLPKPVTDTGVKILIDPEVPPGLIYRIQIAVFRNPVSPSYFKGITPVYGFKVAGTDKTSYYIGMFRRLSEANKALSTVKSKGFKDSFIVSLLGNKQVSADRAAVLEKEWGKKPFLSTIETQAETPLDTLPPVLSFRVEVLRSSSPVKPDVLQGIEKMAGSRGLDIQPLSDGKFAYLIGNFITFDSAAEYADLLIRNGYREAKVVAWLGKREIPVGTAKQLIENVK